MTRWLLLFYLVPGLLMSNPAGALECVDADQDGFGEGAGCIGDDVDDNASSCTTDAADSDSDGIWDCLDRCGDADGDDYGTDWTGSVFGAGKYPVGACTTDGSTPCSFSDAVCINFDCNDGDSGVNPGQTDNPGDDIDNNCDGSVACFADADRDGFGTTTSGESSFSATNGVADTSGACASSSSDYWDDTDDDCNDANNGINPGAIDDPGDNYDENCSNTLVCYVDDDKDGFGATTSSESTYTATAGVADSTGACGSSSSDIWDDTDNDCNDADSGTHPGAVDLPGNDFDENCSNTLACYDDDDKDGFGVTSSTETTYIATAGVADAAGACGSSSSDSWDNSDDDCNGGNSGINPGAIDLPGNDLDENCSNTIVCYVDDDNDGFGATTSAESAHAATAGVAYVTGACGSSSSDSWDNTDDDCDDSDSSQNPAASEVIGDNVDQDCNGEEICYQDTDNDGYRHYSNTIFSTANESCTDPGEAEASDGFDCDDNDAAQNPGAEEIIGDGKDGDCDGTEICYQDNDKDGYRTDDTVLSVANESCTTNAGEATAAQRSGDCNDDNPAIYPGATEIWYDGVDQSCEANNDYDQDFDTYVSDQHPGKTGGTAPFAGDCEDIDNLINPGATDSLGDGIDQNCDGVDGADSDGDTVDNSVDNCIDDYNPNQLDANSDGVGNVCDPQNICFDRNTELQDEDYSNHVYCAAAESITAGGVDPDFVPADGQVEGVVIRGPGRVVLSAPIIELVPPFEVLTGGVFSAGANLAPACDLSGFSAIGQIAQDNGSISYYALSSASDPYDALVIELFAPFYMGTFDLTGENYADCQQCVTLYTGCTQISGCETTYLASSGTLTVTSINSLFEGSLERLELQQVTVDQDYVSTPVPDGSIYCISNWDFVAPYSP